MKRILVLIVILFVIGCKTKPKQVNERFSVVTTTTMITDLVKNIGGDKLEVKGLMGAGVDPSCFNVVFCNRNIH